MNDSSVYQSINTNLSAKQRLLEQRRALDEAAIVTEADLTGKITYVNKKFVEISGYTQDELLGKNHSVINSGTHGFSFFQNMWRTISAGKTWQGDICNRKKDGSIYWVQSTIIPILDPSNQKPIRYQSIRFDITHKKLLEQTLYHQATTDMLTGLSNRFALREYFTHSKSLADRQKSLVAVCLIDLDNFKPINDKFGHTIGDHALIELALRLKHSLRDHDNIGRLGGDEFILILNNLSTHEEIIACLHRVFHSIEQPIQLESQRITLSASVGVAIYPDHNDELDMLIRDADHAMYLAKQQGKNQFIFYDESDDLAQVAFNNLISDVQQGLSNNEFHLHYQPKINMRTGQILGMEALLRWQHPTKGIIPPLHYLPKIEQHDIIIELGNWILESALIQIAEWHKQGKNWVVSINIASHQLQDSNFFNNLTDALRRSAGAPAHLLELEILETVVLSDVGYIQDLIIKCQALGIHVALDDFGTGYSSLSYLKSLPTETIKIDQSFVRDMQTDPGDLAIIEATISIGKAFNRQVLSEGVETDEQGVILMRLGCELAQGYGIAKPMPANEVLNWAEHYQPNALWQQWNTKTWSMSDLPLVMAQRDHINWIKQLEDFVNKPHIVTEPNIEYHHHCRFGQWYYGVGKRYASSSAYHAIEEPHRKIHDLAHLILDDVKQGNLEQARQNLKSVTDLKQEVLFHLMNLQSLALSGKS